MKSQRVKPLKFSKYEECITSAQNPTLWTLSNKVLYDFCQENPDHKNKETSIAKVLLIGRVYAASVERGNKPRDIVVDNDDFYTKHVARRMTTGMDKAMAPLKALNSQHVGYENLEKILTAHAEVNKIFKFEKNKPSLASKYLHFHFPELFFIYDSRARKGLGLLGYSNKLCYKTFCSECLRLGNDIKLHYPSLDLSPRHMDNILLAVAK